MVDMLIAVAAYFSSPPYAADTMTHCVITGIADSAMNTFFVISGSLKRMHSPRVMSGAIINRIAMAKQKLASALISRSDVSEIINPTYMSMSGDTVSPM